MGPPNFSTTRERSTAHRAVLASAGVAYDASLVATGHFTRDGGYEATKDLVAGRARFTAIFAANDLMAMGALAALRESGLRVPDDVSVIGFDDVPTVRDVVPGLTTVSVPMREMGRRSIRIGLAGADGGPRLEMLPVYLLKRESVRSPA
jgi:LacI family transcriptional regulator